MAKAKKEAETEGKRETAVQEKEKTKRFKGRQLLCMPRYMTRAARVVLKPEERYSFEEADAAVDRFMKNGRESVK